MSCPVEIPPTEINNHKYLQTTNAALSRELRTHLREPFGHLYEGYMSFLTVAPGIAQDFWRTPMDEVPYALSTIPPNLIDLPGGDRRTFDSPEMLDDYLPTFWQQDEQLGQTAGGLFVDTSKKRATVTKELQYQLFDREVDWQQWPIYQQSYHDQVARRQFNLSANAAYLAKVRPFSEDLKINETLPEQYDSFLIGDAVLFKPDPNQITTSLIRMPIGEYGQPFARRLLATAIAMVALIPLNNRYLAALDQGLASHETARFVQAHVQRANSLGGAGSHEDTADRVRFMSQEAVHTILSTIGLLTARQVEGYEDKPDHLLEAIITQGMLDKTAQITPFGVVGPATLYGRHLPEALQASTDGRLQISRRMIGSLAVAKANSTALYADEWRQYRAGATEKPPVQTGLICPFAGKEKRRDGQLDDSTITRYGRMFLATYNAVNDLRYVPGIF